MWGFGVFFLFGRFGLSKVQLSKHGGRTGMGGEEVGVLKLGGGGGGVYSCCFDISSRHKKRQNEKKAIPSYPLKQSFSKWGPGNNLVAKWQEKCGEKKSHDFMKSQFGQNDEVLFFFVEFTWSEIKDGKTTKIVFVIFLKKQG